MNNTLNYVVGGVTFFLFMFAALSPLNPNYDLMFILFMIGQLLVPYMVYVVLKYGEESKNEFETSFYDDSAYVRTKDGR